jgi:SAM-dependent methyltransferase
MGGDDWLERHAAMIAAAADRVAGAAEAVAPASRTAPRALDLGCGSGADTAWLLGKGWKVLASDFSAEALELVRASCPGAETMAFDMSRGLPLAAASFGLVVADLSLHYFPWATSLTVMADIARVLAPGGLLLARLNSIRDLNYGAGEGEEIERHLYRRDGRMKRFFDADEVAALLEGWEAIEKVEASTRKYGEEKFLWEVAAKPAMKA